MREKFELCVKVVGLLLLCAGILMALTAILSFIHRPHDDIFERPAFLPDSPLAAQLREHTQLTTSRLFTWLLAHMLLSAIAPGALGAYLMHSNNLVVRLCYPQEHERVRLGPPSGPPAVDVNPAGATGTKSRPDTQYAPPGYFQ